MSLLVLALIAVVLTAVVAVVSAPLRARAAPRGESSSDLGGSERASDSGFAGADRAGAETARIRAELEAELEASREAKYREIRDAELDFRTGKLSEPDYRSLEAGLRAEAAEILRQLDRVASR